MSAITFRTSGFTLVEIMIVLTMIIIIISSGFFPFNYYLERARVEKALDALGGEWIIAHQDIRGGKVHEGTDSHAFITIEFEKGKNVISFSTFTGGTSPKKEYKKYRLEGSIQILGFTGSISSDTQKVTYLIAPPFATGSFSTGGTTFGYLTGVIMTIGYPGSTIESRRAREISLRPYFD